MGKPWPTEALANMLIGGTKKDLQLKSSYQCEIFQFVPATFRYLKNVRINPGIAGENMVPEPACQREEASEEAGGTDPQR